MIECGHANQRGTWSSVGSAWKPITCTPEQYCTVTWACTLFTLLIAIKPCPSIRVKGNRGADSRECSQCDSFSQIPFVDYISPNESRECYFRQRTSGLVYNRISPQEPELTSIRSRQRNRTCCCTDTAHIDAFFIVTHTSE